jgi:N-acetylmuramoyl-L-alanine amidase
MRIISDDTIATLNIWMEARGQKFEGKVAIGEVMLNRLNGGWAKTLVEVILAPYQFSGWNSKDRNRILAVLLDDQDSEYQDCVKAWDAAKAGTTYTRGAVFYYNPTTITTPPDWALKAKKTAIIGSHHFYLA